MSAFNNQEQAAVTEAAEFVVIDRRLQALRKEMKISFASGVWVAQ
jgi:hypothetical protein